MHSNVAKHTVGYVGVERTALPSFHKDTYTTKVQGQDPSKGNSSKRPGASSATSLEKSVTMVQNMALVAAAGFCLSSNGALLQAPATLPSHGAGACSPLRFLYFPRTASRLAARGRNGHFPGTARLDAACV